MAVKPTAPIDPASSSSGQDTASLFARYRAVSGSARWDAVGAVQTDATLRTGGLSGPLVTIEEPSGRSVSHYTLGPVQGAEGYDGKQSWRQDPGGEVVSLDAPDARERAVTNAWLASLGSPHPERQVSAFSPIRTVDEAGKRWQVVEATPKGGTPVSLWFDAATGLLGRTVSRDGGSAETSTMDDYRDVDGTRVAFHTAIDRTDASGRVDPREHVDIQVQRVAPIAAPDTAVFSAPAMKDSAHIVDASGVTQVPFDLVNNHIYADAILDGTRVRVLVDTGGANVLGPTAARRLGMKSEGKMSAQGVGEERVDASMARVGEVRLGGAVLSNTVFYVMDLDGLQPVEGVAHDGLIGFEMFRRFCVTVDYARRMLTLTDPAKFQPPADAQVVSFELADRIPIVSATLDGMPVRLSVDTGSRASLSLDSPFVQKNDLVTRYAASPESVTGWGVGGPARGRMARGGVLMLGNVAVRDLVLDLFTGDKGALANPDLSGNLGAGVLKRFTVSFDYDAKKMYLTPNADFAKPDTYDRSGMWLLADGDALKVAAVFPGGPAEKAGIKVGDRIAKLGGEEIAHRSLPEWRVRLRELPVGTRVAATVRAPTGDRSMTLVLADLVPPYVPRH